MVSFLSIVLRAVLCMCIGFSAAVPAVKKQSKMTTELEQKAERC